jgi:hypothetical protein
MESGVVSRALPPAQVFLCGCVSHLCVVWSPSPPLTHPINHPCAQIAEDVHPSVRVSVAYGLEAIAETYSKNVSESSRKYYGDVAELMWALVLDSCDADTSENLEHGLNFKDDPSLQWRDLPGGSTVVSVVLQRVLPVVVRVTGCGVGCGLGRGRGGCRWVWVWVCCRYPRDCLTPPASCTLRSPCRVLCYEVIGGC